MILTLNVNGIKHQVLVNEHDTLSKVLREKINLTGTKMGCEQGSCGACTVFADGEAIQSCITLALKMEGSNITTIEGISNKNEPHKLQTKFVEHGAIQCGYCTPGMVMTTLSFLDENPNPNKEKI